MFNNCLSENLWHNVEKCCGATGTTDYVTMWRIRVACCISKATRAHEHGTPTRPVNHTQASPQYVICNTYCFCTAVMIRERAWMSRYTYIACLVLSSIQLLKRVFLQTLVLAQLVSKFLPFMEFNNLLPRLHQFCYTLSIYIRISPDFAFYLHNFTSNITVLSMPAGAKRKCHFSMLTFETTYAFCMLSHVSI